MANHVRHLRWGAVLATILWGGFVSPALAAANVVHAHAPRHARVSDARTAHFYSVGASGYAQKQERLYVFVDYNHCTGSPGGEHARLGVNGDIWTVRGTFRANASGWTANWPGKDHVCAYLVKASAPTNPFHGVLARDFATFRVHS